MGREATAVEGGGRPPGAGGHHWRRLRGVIPTVPPTGTRERGRPSDLRGTVAFMAIMAVALVLLIVIVSVR